MEKKWKEQAAKIRKEKWLNSPEGYQWIIKKQAKRKTKAELRAELEAAADEIEIATEVYDPEESGSAYAKHQRAKV